MQTKTDLIDALRDRAYSFKSPDKLVAQAADEIERLRRMVRLQDGVIRSGGVATLTHDERMALEALIPQTDCYNPKWSATLRGLLERLT